MNLATLILVCAYVSACNCAKLATNLNKDVDRNGMLIADELEPEVKDVALIITEDEKTNAVVVDANNNAGSDKNDSGTEEKVFYRGAQVWRIAYDSGKRKHAVAILHNTYSDDIMTWGGNESAIDVMLRPRSIGPASRLLEDAQVPYDVVIEDLQTAIDTENPPPEEIEELQNRKGHRMTWQAYHKTEDINSYLDYLASTYPQLCSVQTIGNSVQGKPLKVLRISNGKPNNKAIWIDGGIHAREWISPASVTYILNEFVENWDEESETIRNIDWYILPVANPDGYEYSHSTDRLWRKNRGGSGLGHCKGIDLNRNFGYRWGGQGASHQPCSETYAGSGAFSEPESAAVRDFLTRSAAKFSAFLTFHSYGQYILHPWGYDRVVPPDYKELTAVGNAAARAMLAAGGATYRVGASGSLLYPASGGSDDWAKGSLNIKYSYTIELRDSGRHGFVLPASYIETTGREALAATRAVAEAVKAL